MLHLKDICEDARAEIRDNCFTAVGEGRIPLKEILETAQRCNLDAEGVIIDQDNSFGDMFEDLAVGVANIKKMLGVNE